MAQPAGREDEQGQGAVQENGCQGDSGEGDETGELSGEGPWAVQFVSDRAEEEVEQRHDGEDSREERR
ncbi:hypothetical protein [Streptomyces virginiae]|uniref:hypothetical protein n=1 Tax=Streptomyces virginiae TaxID=1961 RepID=UPI0004C75A66|nr:hypothetical protein [Streptomyces virginiae]